jgi:hypothetical protein
MPDFSKFFNALSGKIADYAAESWKEYSEEVVKDGGAFLEKAKDDLERWSKELAEGKLSKEDFGWLVQGKKDLAEMEALKQAGLAKAQIDRCKNDILSMVIDTAFKIFI